MIWVLFRVPHREFNGEHLTHIWSLGACGAGGSRAGTSVVHVSECDPIRIMIAHYVWCHPLGRAGRQ